MKKKKEKYTSDTRVLNFIPPQKKKKKQKRYSILRDQTKARWFDRSIDQNYGIIERYKRGYKYERNVKWEFKRPLVDEF